MNALFLHDPADLHAAVPGGVQLCSHEFLAVVQTAAKHTDTFEVSRSTRLVDRISRRLGVKSYATYNPATAKTRLEQHLKRAAITHVFVNRCELVRYCSLIKEIDSSITTVLLSHGNQSGDDLYEVAGAEGRRNRGWNRLTATWRLGLDLRTEAALRHQSVDAVGVMSHEESVIERWLGVSRTIVLPRLLVPDPLERQPVPGRVGYVGTLTHTPNRIALERLCRTWNPTSPSAPTQLRVVGRGDAVGRDLAIRYPFIKYLGALDQSALREEAATWSVFLNPIFWLSRGASMKLGQALAWGLPVLSTVSGARGYEWSQGELPLTADNEQDFMAHLEKLTGSDATLADAGRECQLVLATSPTTEDLAARLRAALV